MSNQQPATSNQQPAVDDLYIVDFSKIYENIDDKYKYGLLKINQIIDQNVQFNASQFGYNKASGVNKDIRDNKVKADTYYNEDLLHIDIDKLKSMKE